MADAPQGGKEYEREVFTNDTVQRVQDEGRSETVSEETRGRYLLGRKNTQTEGINRAWN